MRPRMRWEYVLLGVFLLFVLWLRMTLATSVDAFDYGAYPTIRETQHVLETGTPLVDDPLSITGAQRVGSPFFPYFLAGLVWLTPATYKLLPNLFMVLLLIPVYFLARNLAGSRIAAAVSVLLAASGPFVFASYLNDPSSVPIAVAVFLTIIALLHAPEKYLYQITALTLLLTFIHPIVFLLVLALACIMLLLRLERFSVDGRLGEMFLFVLLLAAWFHVITYHRALINDGVRVLWKNLPAAYASTTFGTVTFLTLLYGIGVIAFLFGVLGAYHVLFERRMRVSLGVLGATFAITLATVFRMVELRIGLMLLTLLLSVLAAHGLRISYEYLQKTKIPSLRYGFAILLLALFLFTALLPAFSNANTELENSPDDAQVAAFRAANAALPQDAIGLTTIREAAAFQYYTGRTTLTDNDFILVDNGDELVADIDAVYTARFSTAVIGKAQKLGFTHILFSADARKTYGRDALEIEIAPCMAVSPLSDGATLYDLSACKEAAR